MLKIPNKNILETNHLLFFKALIKFENTYLHKYNNKTILLVVCIKLVSYFNLDGKVKTVSINV